jgi:hypothetical protein
MADETRAQSEFWTQTTQVAFVVLQAGVAGVLMQSSLSRHWTHIMEKLSQRGSGAEQSVSAAQEVALAQVLLLRQRSPVGHSEFTVQATQTPSGRQWPSPASALHCSSDMHFVLEVSQIPAVLQIIPPSAEH